MVKENHYKKWCQNSCAWERTDNSSVPLGFSPLQYMTSKIYMQPLQYHWNDMTQTYAKVAVSKKKKADSASVCFDGEQTRWVNRLQCVRLLFLHCITATPQPDELATLTDCVPPRAKLCWEWLRRDISHMAADSLWVYAESWVCCSIM